MKRPLWKLILVFLGICTGWGCPARQTASVTAADAGGGAEDAGLEAADASVPAPKPRSIAAELTITGVDGGQTTVIPSADAGTLEIEPARTIELRLTPRPNTPRVLLFDWTEQIVESNDTGPSQADGPDYTYRIELLDPLQPGRVYLLSVDSEVGPRLLDALGAPLDELRLTLKVTGELKADSGGKAGPNRRKRRR